MGGFEVVSGGETVSSGVEGDALSHSCWLLDMLFRKILEVLTVFGRDIRPDTDTCALRSLRKLH
jgi:hypothetical protein